MSKLTYLVEIDTTKAVTDLGDLTEWLIEVVQDGLGPAYIGDAPVRVLTPSGSSTKADDPESQWLRFPK